MEPWQLATQFGFALGMCVWFVWRSDVREKRMTQTIDDQNQFIREALIERDNERATAMSELGAAMRQQAAAIDNLVRETRATRQERTNGGGGH